MTNGLQDLFENKGEFSRRAEKHAEYASQMTCPFMQGRAVTLHNKMNGYYTVPVGVNRIADNDVTLPESRACLGPRCMAYDFESKTCKRCYD